MWVIFNPQSLIRIATNICNLEYNFLTLYLLNISWIMKYATNWARCCVMFLDFFFPNSNDHWVNIIIRTFLKRVQKLRKIKAKAFQIWDLKSDSVQFNSVAQSCPTLCDPKNLSMPGLPVHHQLPEFTQTHVHRIGDTIQPSHPLSSRSPPAPNSSQYQGLFQWVNSSHEVAKVLEFQLQPQSFQWTPRIDLL